MILTDQFDGSTDPVEGDRTILWRSLPANARVIKAVLTITPVAPPGGSLFEEVIAFASVQGDPGTTQGDLGATKNVGSGFVEVDFHKRRTLTSVTGTNLLPSGSISGVNLQVDLGGMYVEINNKGAIKSPGDTLFTLHSDGALPGLTLGKFKLTPSPGGGTQLDVGSVVIRSAPSNVTVRVGTLGPFYTHNGDLPTADTASDFSAVLQAYLTQAKIDNGFYVIPFTLHSDTLCRLDLGLNVEFVSQANLQPADIKEVLVPFDFNTLPKTEGSPLSINLPPNAQVLPLQTSAKLIGAFNTSRIIHGVPAGATPPPYVVHVSATESQAQQIAPDVGLGAQAIDVLVTAISSAAQLTLDLRGDLDGKPDGSSVLHKPVDFQVPFRVDQLPQWISVSLQAEFSFLAGTAYWLVLASLQGEVAWSTQPAVAGSVGVQHSLDGELSWHYAGSLGASGPLDASYRLRQSPAIFQVPLALKVGTGDQSAPVSLDRFQPLGKIDFTLDTPEFADGFNQYLTSSVSAACPQGEQLANGDFELWTAAGDTAGQPSQINVPGTVAIATVSNGRWIYVAAQVYISPNEQTTLQVVDSLCEELSPNEVNLQMIDRPIGLAVNSAGDRAYVVSGSTLCVIDTKAAVPLGTPLPFTALPSALQSSQAFAGPLAVSPDGERIYLTLGSGFQGGSGTSGYVIAVAKDVLEQVVRGARSLAASDITQAAISGVPQTARLSPDGTSMYLAIKTSTSLLVLDTGSFTIANAGIEIGAQPVSIDFTPDGKSAALLTNQNGATIHLIDSASDTLVESLGLGSTYSPVAVTVSPLGGRAFVLITGPLGGSTPGGSVPVGIARLTEATASAAGYLVPVDLGQMIAEAPIALDSVGTAIAVSPQGDRVYIIGTNTSDVTIVPFGSRSPAEWFVTSDVPSTPGEVFPYCIPSPSPVDLAVVFGKHGLRRLIEPNTVATGLSQVIPAFGPCTYDFSFFALSDDPSAAAEIFWLGSNSSLLKTDSVPIQTRSRRQLLPHLARLNSPTGTAQAEVRFTAQPYTNLAVGKASLIGTSQVLGNGGLEANPTGMPAGWTLQPAFAYGVSVSTTNGVVRIINSGLTDAALTQSAPIGENVQFAWEFQGRPVPLGAAQARPRVELRWQKGDGSLIGTPAQFQIAGDGFPRYRAAGVTPAGTARVAISLIAPAGTELEIDSVSLETPQTVPVPLTFISQGPGELRVSKSQVTYDVVPVPPPPVPSGGLATPTPPDGTPGEQPCTAYCPCCKDERTITQAQPRISPAGRPLLVGLCPVCGSELVRPGGLKSAEAQPWPVRLLAAHGTSRAPGRPRSIPSTIPLTALRSLEKDRAGQLSRIGIDSVEKLAAASPEDVSKSAHQTSPEQAGSLIAEAKKFLAAAKPPLSRKRFLWY
jgi:DNA-binding beta-propeller fold protein YncE